MINFKCRKCHSNEFFIKEKGGQRGLYCADCGAWQKWLNKDEYNAYSNATKSIKPITNLEKLSQLDTMANLVYGYGTSFYDEYYCHSDCPCEKGALKSDCLKCIKQWLESGAVV